MNPGHIHPRASALLSGGERGESRVASRFACPIPRSRRSPEQEGTALDVRSAEKKVILCPKQPPEKISLKKNTHNGLDTNKRKKKRAMMMTLCSVRFPPAPMMRS